MIRDYNDDEEEFEIVREKLELKMTMEERIIIVISNIGGKPKLHTPIYSDSLNPTELIDWIGEIQ